MSRVVDVVVVGLGAMGSSSLMHLAMAGLDVVGLDAHGVGHALGSSSGESRIIRKAYFEDPRYVPLLERAYHLWGELESTAGRRLLRRCGIMNIGRLSHPHMQGVLKSAAEHHLAVEQLSARALRSRFSSFVANADDEAVYEADGGVLAPEAIVTVQLALAKQHGARLMTGERVVAVEPGEHGTRLTTERGEAIVARHVVVSAGPWWATVPFLRDVSRAVFVQRQVQHFFSASSLPTTATATMPAFIHFDGDAAFYGVPAAFGDGGGGDDIKVCRHGDGARTTADTVDRVVNDDDVKDVRAFVGTHLPSLDAPPVRSTVCMYSMSPDGHFIVGRHPEHQRIIVLAGFSGHGFKFASVIGEGVRAAIESGAFPPGFELFSPARFS